MEMANSSKMQERRKIKIFMERGESLGCKQEGFMELIKVPHSKGIRALEAQARRGRRWVCVCVRSSTLQASMKALRSFTHKELESAFFLHKDPFL